MFFRWLSTIPCNAVHTSSPPSHTFGFTSGGSRLLRSHSEHLIFFKSCYHSNGFIRISASANDWIDQHRLYPHGHKRAKEGSAWFRAARLTTAMVCPHNAASGNLHSDRTGKRACEISPTIRHHKNATSLFPQFCSAQLITCWVARLSCGATYSQAIIRK